MLSVYICEDNLKQLELFSEYVNQSIVFKDYSIKLEYSTTRPYELLDYLTSKQEKSVGLYFLDINLNCSMNGLQLANKIRELDPRGFIVFITTHSEMSFMVFQYGIEPLDYILKDIPDTIKSKIELNLVRAYERYICANSNSKVSITVKSGNRDILINTFDILFIDSSVVTHKLEIHTKSEIISIYGSLSDILKQLTNNFYRCHKSFIINIDFVKEIDTSNRLIKLVNKDTCPVSLQYLKNIKKAMNDR